AVSRWLTCPRALAVLPVPSGLSASVSLMLATAWLCSARPAASPHRRRNRSSVPVEEIGPATHGSPVSAAGQLRWRSPSHTVLSAIRQQSQAQGGVSAGGRRDGATGARRLALAGVPASISREIAATAVTSQRRDLKSLNVTIVASFDSFSGPDLAHLHGRGWTRGGHRGEPGFRVRVGPHADTPRREPDGVVGRIRRRVRIG